MGLGLIIIAGAELLTANSCYLSAAVFEVSNHRNGVLPSPSLSIWQHLICKVLQSVARVM